MKKENEDGDRDALKICTQINTINNYTYYYNKDILRRQYSCEVHAVYIVVYSWR